MKKHFFFTLLLAVNISVAQKSFELAGGFNYSSAISRTIDFNPQIGLQIGILKPINITNNLTIKSGLVFLSRNFKSKQEIEFSGIGVSGVAWVDNKSRFNYLHIPLRVSLGHPKGFEFSLGAFMDYLIKGSSQLLMGSFDYPLDWDEQIDVSKTYLGISTGISYKFPEIVVGIDFQQHLTNFSEELKSDFGSNRIRSLNLTISYFLYHR